ncbi:hypothetical protein PPYR_12341 [Photinus pyralis]|uniref:Uncharacterized protein n=1 Tax=Photinus pyralis TaxID=7054 RepID=A0A5N4ADV3_PHOPY|nr:hypothetical protein PPYR_12341 [Photinus pyralis]
MGLKNGKAARKRLKKFPSFPESKSDSELPRFVPRKNSWINDINSPAKLKANGEHFTPFTKIPAIGEKLLTANYHSDSDTLKVRGASSKIPILRSHSVNKGSVRFGPKEAEEPRPALLVRCNTYVVLDPVICIKPKDDLNKTYTKSKSDNIKVFGSKLTSDLFVNENNAKVDVRRSDLSALNYLFNNLNLSRSRKNNPLLSKNNPWLL